MAKQIYSPTRGKYGVLCYLDYKRHSIYPQDPAVELLILSFCSLSRLALGLGGAAVQKNDYRESI